MRDNNIKIKLVKVIDYLRTESSEEEPKSTNEILEYLRSVGAKCDRKTLYQDMDFLAANGINIIKTRKSKENAYYIPNDNLSLAEMKILVDAVQAANFITDCKTAELVNKLTALSGEYKKFSSLVFTSTKTKKLSFRATISISSLPARKFLSKIL